MLPIKGTFSAQSICQMGDTVLCRGLQVDLWNGEARIYGVKISLSQTLDGELYDEEAKAVDHLCCSCRPRKLGTFWIDLPHNLTHDYEVDAGRLELLIKVRRRQ